MFMRVNSKCAHQARPPFSVDELFGTHLIT
jgi:hypothetical protein